MLAGKRHGGAVWTARDGAGHFARTRDARRFRELIRAEVAATVNDPADVADELRHLIAVAGSS